VKATLTYHSLDDSGSAISVAPAMFAQHLAWLTSGRVRVLSLNQLIAHADDATDAVAVTFDDGFLNVRDAIEQLRSHGVPVSLFVVSGSAGGTNAWGGATQRGIPTLPLLGWGDLERLVALGAAVEAHTRSHTVLTALSGSALDEELGGCQDELHARLGTRSSHLAYPYGEVNDAVEARVGTFFRYAHTTQFRFLAGSDTALRLPRLDMYYFRAPGLLETWGTPAFARHVAWCARRRKIRSYLLQGGTMRFMRA
jgi:peptidoglycan/xylan/chitin deacetylase (PgdA/CDA1 family)